MAMNLHHPKSGIIEIYAQFKGFCLKTSLLLLLLSATVNFYGQQNSIASENLHNKRKPEFRKLWRSQAYLNLGILGYRSVTETDIFALKQFNPNGPDIIKFDELEVVNRQSFYPLFTTGGAVNRVFPLLTSGNLTFHAEISGMVLFQKIFAPSVSDNSVRDSLHFPVMHYNMPSILNISLSGGFWLGELFCIGARVNRNGYYISTNDDRKEQKQLSRISVTVDPYVSLWLPLENTAMRRWTTRITFDGSIPNGNNSEFGIPSAELVFFRLSKQHSGLVTGFFVRYLKCPDIVNPGKYPFYKMNHDAQIIMGFNIGTGGLNRRSGR